MRNLFARRPEITPAVSAVPGLSFRLAHPLWLLKARKRAALWRYGRTLDRLGREDIPSRRAGLVAVMAARAYEISAWEADDDASEYWLTATGILDRVQASEICQVLVDADLGPDEHHELWMHLARARCIDDRIELFIALIASYCDARNRAAADVLRDIARSEVEAARRFPHRTRDSNSKEDRYGTTA